MISFLLYSLKKNSPSRRSQLLQPIVVSSLFLWSFLGVSLLLCAALLGQYENFPELTIREVLGGSLLTSLAFAGIMSLVARRHAFSKILQHMTGTAGIGSISTGFGLLTSRMNIHGVTLREATYGNAFSLSLNGQGVIAVSPVLAASLSKDETEAVLAHELSHIKNGDSAAKSVARLARLAFPFDPVSRLAEAAVHRERELWADRVAVEFTEKPLALASALVKANSREVADVANAAGLFVGGNGKGLFSFYPNLERRVDALLELARQMDASRQTILASV